MLFPRNRSEQYYRDLYETVQVIPGKEQLLKGTCDLIEAGRKDYEVAVKGTAVPWEFVGLIHCLEADCDFDKQLFNGGRWDKTTVVWPNRTVGPWTSWQNAVKAMLHGGMAAYGGVPGFPYFAGMTDWEPYRLLCRAECWNGTGYASMNKNSPYIWGLTNHGVGVGKYTSDGKYDPTAKTADIGCAALLKELRRRQAVAATPTPAPTVETKYANVSLEWLTQVKKTVDELCEQFKGVKP